MDSFAIRWQGEIPIPSIEYGQALRQAQSSPEGEEAEPPLDSSEHAVPG